MDILEAFIGMHAWAGIKPSDIVRIVNTTGRSIAGRKPGDKEVPVHNNKPKRNESCPCGSGFKYKRCCGRQKGE